MACVHICVGICGAEGEGCDLCFVNNGDYGDVVERRVIIFPCEYGETPTSPYILENQCLLTQYVIRFNMTAEIEFVNTCEALKCTYEQLEECGEYWFNLVQAQGAGVLAGGWKCCLCNH